MTGLVPAFSTGPVFLTLLQQAIDHGFKKALYFIVGVALTDSAIIMLTWLGLSRVSSDSSSPAWLTVGGGVLLVLFGLVFVLRKGDSGEPAVDAPPGQRQAFGLFTQAIMLNAVNPVIWGFWAAISNYAIAEFHDTTYELLFFAGVLNMIWTTDLLKAYYAQKLKKYLDEKIKNYIRLGIGVVLILLGTKLIVEFLIA